MMLPPQAQCQIFSPIRECNATVTAYHTLGGPGSPGGYGYFEPDPNNSGKYRYVVPWSVDWSCDDQGQSGCSICIQTSVKKQGGTVIRTYLHTDAAACNTSGTSFITSIFSNLDLGAFYVFDISVRPFTSSLGDCSHQDWTTSVGFGGGFTVPTSISQ
jgi:hypothetical protein